jgi:hypothetical protein
MNQTKKNSVNVGNINQMIKDEIFKSSYLKILIYIGVGTGSLFAIAIILKSVNYAAHNFKNLSATLKR